jgi:DNA-binding transcriptional LysR family regulator
MVAMNLDSLQSFRSVADAGSFSIAAARLGVMQSTISGRIQSLEKELGCVLFRRGRAGAELTPAGHDFRPLAERIVQTWDQARHQVALPDGFTATFRFGGPVALQDQLNVAWVLWMKEHAPTVALQLEAGYSDTLTDRILAGTMDAATLYLPRQRPGLVVEELLIEKLVLVRHPQMEGAWQDHFVMVNWGQDFGREFVEAFPDAPIPTISVGLGALGLQYVLALKGAAYLPRSLVDSMLVEQRLCPVEGAPVFERPVYLVYPAFSRDPELQSLALGGVRGVAATLSSGA